MVSRYVTNGPVKQEGICLLPPTHFRMIPPRTDTFHPPQAFVSQQPQNQASNQGQGLRGMAPTGPPNQSSTPPNTEMKVQQMPQQPTLNIPYVQSNSARTGQNFYQRAPPNQTPRMQTHRQSQQQLYQTQPPYMQLPQTVFMNTMSYFNSQPRPSFTLPQMLPGQPAYPQFYHQSPTQTQTYYYNANLPIPMQRAAPPQAVAAPQNLTQPPPTVHIPQAAQPHNTLNKNKRRANAIPVIDPQTGVDQLAEIFETPPRSGECSARQTPQPAPHNPNKEIQATFAKQVAQAIGNDEEIIEDMPDHAAPLPDHIDTHIFHNPQVVQTRIDIAQSSKLQAQTKEFYPMQQTPAKETTPVVSAITDAVEVTITNKSKDRESPAKNKKREPKEVLKEEKIYTKEDKHKENVASAVPVAAPVAPAAPVVPFVAAPPPQPPTKDTPAVPKEEKKNAKKEKYEPKTVSPAASFVPAESVPDNVAAVPAAHLVNNAQENAKTKTSSNQRKEVSKQSSTPAAQKSQAVAPVPPSQPSKPNNKTSKMRDLNLKGANKEGTDMDAFHDANNEGVTAPPPTPNESNDTNKNTDSSSNDPQTIKPETTKPFPKTKCITDIVKEEPKPIKTFYPLPESQDTNQTGLANEKTVQAKNEANTKSNAETSSDANVNNTKPALPYKEGQWAPFNQTGKRVYDKEFLWALRNDEKSRKRPDNILNELIATEDRARVDNINRYPTGGRTNDFAPNFGGNYSGKSSSRGAPPKRNSQQGKIGGGSKGSKSNIIRVSISVKEDVKLHESENAWKPTRFGQGAVETEEDKKTKELYKKVRGVLNKLTPQKFNTLLGQVRALTVDTTERLQGVIDLVFEKAIDEPNFSEAYALMCRELAMMQVPSGTTESKGADGAEFVNFRKLLVTRCQYEFEKNSVDEKTRNKKMKEIESCADSEKKKEMQVVLEEDDRKLRMKSVGYIRFIGELFKQQMLTVKIMMRCLHKLLETREEESLECLCKLLTTVGKELEQKNNDLNPIFNIMRDIADRKNMSVNSRIRFMIQDVIDLRSAKWQPRRQDLNPKTIDQIQKEANDEQMTIHAMNSMPMAPRKDDRNNSGSGPDRKRGNRNVIGSNEEGWSVASSRNRNAPSFSVQSDKLKNKIPQLDEPLGCSQMFGNWVRGSNIKTSNAPSPATSSSNMYAPLESIGNDTDKRSIGMNRSNNRDPYNSKGPSLERSYKQSYDGRGSRSGSQHRSAENSQRSTPTPVQNISKPQPQAAPTPPPPVAGMSEEQLKRRLKNILEEYLNECCTIEECNEELRQCVAPNALNQFVCDSYMNVLERSETARKKCGEMFGKLVKIKTLSVDCYLKETEEILSQADELIIDIPKLWDCLAETIAPVLAMEAVSLSAIYKSASVLLPMGHMANFLGPLFKLLVQEKGPKFLQTIWQNSKLNLASFLETNEINSFVEEYNLGVLVGVTSSPPAQSILSYEKVHEKLLQFFQNDNSFDDITEWISAHVGDRVKDNKFIRTLFSAILEHSIENKKINAEVLLSHYKLLHRYVDNHATYELQCLYALQALVDKLLHPAGLLLQICTQLLENGVFPQESFLTWESSKDPAEQEGKGVSIKQLTSFFTQLKEVDDESASSASEDA